MEKKAPETKTIQRKPRVQTPIQVNESNLPTRTIITNPIQVEIIKNI
jgi:hypothetical protein